MLRLMGAMAITGACGSSDGAQGNPQPASRGIEDEIVDAAPVVKESEPSAARETASLTEGIAVPPFDVVDSSGSGSFCQLCRPDGELTIIAVGDFDDPELADDLRDLAAIRYKYGQERVKVFAVVHVSVAGARVPPDLQEEWRIDFPVFSPEMNRPKSWISPLLGQGRTFLLLDRAHRLRHRSTNPSDFFALNVVLRELLDSNTADPSDRSSLSPPRRSEPPDRAVLADD